MTSNCPLTIRFSGIDLITSNFRSFSETLYFLNRPLLFMNVIITWIRFTLCKRFRWLVHPVACLPICVMVPRNGGRACWLQSAAKSLVGPSVTPQRCGRLLVLQLEWVRPWQPQAAPPLARSRLRGRLAGALHGATASTS